MRRHPPFDLGTRPKGEEINFAGVAVSFMTLSFSICVAKSLSRISGASLAEMRFG